MKAIRPLIVVALFAALAIVIPEQSSSDSHDIPQQNATLPPDGAQAESGPAREIVIGGGSVAGVYFPAAGAICRVVTAHTPGSRCLVESNANSSANLERLTGGLLDFAVVQSDWLMHASRGTNLFRPNGPDDSLRAVFSLHAESLTLVARAGARIDGPADLEDKRVNLGPAFTYQRVLTEAMLRAVGLDDDDLAVARETSAAAQFSALCAGELDAAAIVAAHPSPILADAMQRCDLQLVPVAGEEIDALLEARPDLAPAAIPGGIYVGVPDAIPTFGLRAVLATTTQVDDELVKAVLDSVLGSLAELNAQHPVLADLAPRTMATAGIGLPLHPAAEQSFKSKGMLPEN